ncbi:hypothetical protein TanjilG_31773 [Lupinus angustifolius]|uniref:Uncharacterized protein n=2 Tax=Lupinus angustifolius TaxID=3871 RepID=A0A4P1RMX1_LUPAN|nr:hypothetical protein TanjilG_31773 [Lupinus angustifolius]
MEHEKKKKNKRAREEEGENKIVGSSFEENNNNNAKKRGFEISFMKDKNKVKEEEAEEGSWDCDSNLGFGVFDFPWLKDGVISKPEDLEDFEDNFMSCLQHQDTSSFKVSGIDNFCDEYGLCETISEASMSHIPDSKLVEDAWKQFDKNNGWKLEAEDADNSTWTSLFNHPL